MTNSRSSRLAGQAPLTVVTESERETRLLGEWLAKSLTIPCVILLRGSLGTGKTTLARGIARGLGVKDTSCVSSPSFTLVNTYEGRCPIFHVDLYRLSGTRDLFSIGLDEVFGSGGVVIIEWSEKLAYPVESALKIEINDLGGNRRQINIQTDKTKASARSHKRTRGRSQMGEKGLQSRRNRAGFS